VLIPTYNGARYLSEAVDSVLRQTYTDFEVLVLDNASTDDTQEILARYRDPRLRIFRNEVNLGFIGNVERGRTLARGQILVDIGSDDVWEPGLLEAVSVFWQCHPGLSFMHLPAIWIDAQGRPCGRSRCELA
jgi:glycosyltransferase involved in cell wall biosynthesis